MIRKIRICGLSFPKLENTKINLVPFSERQFNDKARMPSKETQRENCPKNIQIDARLGTDKRFWVSSNVPLGCRHASSFPVSLSLSLSFIPSSFSLSLIHSSFFFFSLLSLFLYPIALPCFPSVIVH